MRRPHHTIVGLAVLLLLATACAERISPSEGPGDGHGSEVDDAIAQVMADYREASGGLHVDRIPCHEYVGWEAVAGVTADLGLEDAAGTGTGRASARGGEMIALTCAFGTAWFEAGNREFSTSTVHVKLLRDAPSPLESFEPATTPAGRDVLVGEADLYDLGGWRDPDLDDTVAVAASSGNSHTVLVAVRIHVGDTAIARALLDAAWVDLDLP